jgi:hypothetical protein
MPLIIKQVNMTVSNLKIGQNKIVVVPERDFERLQRESENYRQLMEEDRVLGKLAEKELKAFRKGGSKGTPWEKVKKELGL